LLKNLFNSINLLKTSLFVNSPKYSVNHQLKVNQGIEK
jgi:hypothetical protein